MNASAPACSVSTSLSTRSNSALQPGALRLIARKLLRQPRERVADRRQARGIQPSDLLAERVEPGEQLLRQPAGGRDVVGVAVAPPLGSTRGEARVMVAFDGAPAVECPETLLEPALVSRPSA